MKKVLIPRAFVLALSGSVCLIAGSPAHAFVFQTVNNPGDPNFNQLLGINNAGTIGGYYGDGSTVPNNGYTTAPPYTSFSAENFPSATQTQVTGINNTGTTVGFYVDNAGDNIGFYQTGGTFVSVANPATGVPAVNQLLGVNDANVAAGFYVNAAGNSQGYLYNITAGTFAPVTLPSSFNTLSWTATGVNNADDVSGFYLNAAGDTVGFLEIGAKFYSLSDPNGNGTNTSIFGLNNKGEAVGSYVDSAGVTQGFVYNWVDNTWLTVSDPLASATPAFGVTGTIVNGINDKGQLVGFFSDGSNVNGFVASVPEPSTWALVLLGFAGIGCAASRKEKREAFAAA